MSVCSAKICISFIFICVILCSGCQKLEIKHVLKVSNTSVLHLSGDNAKVQSSIIDQGHGINSYGHCWSTFKNPTLADNNTSFTPKTVLNNFTSNIQNLRSSTTYYVRAYAIYHNNITYGKELILKTEEISPPAVRYSSFRKTNKTNIKFFGKIESFGGASNVIDYGLCWSKDSIPEITDFKDSKGFCDNISNCGSFHCLADFLDTNVLYYFRGYAISEYYISYGKTVKYNSNFASPIVELQVIDSLTTQHSATIKINVINDDNNTSYFGLKIFKCSNKFNEMDEILIDVNEHNLYTYNGFSPDNCYTIQVWVNNLWEYVYSPSITLNTLP